MTRLPVGSAEELAFSPEFADGTWRDGEGRSLIDAVVWALGPEAGADMWRRAEDLFVSRDLAASQRGLSLAANRKRWPLTPELRLASRGRSC